MTAVSKSPSAETYRPLFDSDGFPVPASIGGIVNGNVITRRPGDLDTATEQIHRLKTKNFNYRNSMKQLQRAHVVTLYAKRRAEETANAQAQYINDLHAELQALRVELRATRDTALDKQEALRNARQDLKELQQLG